jgi:hypothetical protein
MDADKSKENQDVIAVVLSPKPKSITHAVRILYATVALSVGTFYLEWLLFQNTQIDFFEMFFFLFFGCGLTLWSIYKVDQGRNWARVLLLILYLLNIPMFIHSFMDLFSYSMILDMLGLTGFVLQAVAYIMLFSRDAHLWFCPPKS